MNFQFLPQYYNFNMFRSPYSTLFYRCSPAPFHHIAPLQNKFGFIQVFPGLCHCLWGNCKGNKGTHEKLWNFGRTCKNMKENRKNLMFLTTGMWIKHYWSTVLRFLCCFFICRLCWCRSPLLQKLCGWCTWWVNAAGSVTSHRSVLHFHLAMQRCQSHSTVELLAALRSCRFCCGKNLSVCARC